MPEGAAKERDALDRWFDMRRKAWWQRWRWVVLLTWILLFGCVASGLIFAFGYRYSHYGYNWTSPPWYLRSMVLFWQTRGYVLVGSVCTLWVAATQAVRSLAMPAEVAITTGPKVIYSRTLQRSRSEVYRILGLPLAALFVLLLLWYGVGLSPSVLGFANASIAAAIAIGIGVFMFTVEWLIALLLRFPPRLGLNWLYVVPFVHIPMTLSFDWLYRYAPAQDSDIPNHLGNLTTWIVALGLLGGGALGWWLWRYLLYNTTAAGHVIMAGLLTSITQIRSGLESASGPGQLFVWLYVSVIHGAALGNPIAGWTSGGISRQTGIPADYYYNWYSHGSHPVYQHYGMYVLPEVFIPVWAALVWIAAYYVISIWAIRSAANVMPRGYTGTWQT